MVQQMSNGHQMQDSDVTRCITNCMNTQRACLEAIHYSLEQKLSGTTRKQLELLQTCVETCNLSVRLMSMDSEFHHQACELCFEVCDACAAEFSNFEEDAVFTRVAQACTLSAESCRGMAGMTVKVNRGAAKDSRANSTRM